MVEFEEVKYGLSGVGALFLPASSSQSRNRSFGYMLGQGLSVEEALKRLNQTVEGVHTVKAVFLFTCGALKAFCKLSREVR